MLALSETRGSKRFLWELTCRGRLIFTRKSTTAPLTEDRSCDLAGLKLEASPEERRAILARVREHASRNKLPVTEEALAAIWREIHGGKAEITV